MIAHANALRTTPFSQHIGGRQFQRPRAATARPALVTCELKEGVKVRVTAPVKVYHVGKFKAGLELEGMEGTVMADVRQFKGLELSAPLAWKVQFAAPGEDGKAVKVIAHLDDDELEVV